MKPSDYIRQGWTKHSSARDSKGRPTSVSSKHATCWCLTGAVSKAYASIYDRSYVLAKVIKQLNMVFVKEVEEWNDASERTQQEVIDVLVAIGE